MTDYLTICDRTWHEAAALWQPPERLTASEWADRYFYLSAESAAEAGKWHTLPYQRAILDAFTEPQVEEIVVKKSARVGYTKVLDAIIGYCIHQDPCSVLAVQPTGDDAKGYAKDEIEPMLRDTPVLAALVPETKSRDSKSTISKKVYPGGIFNLVGAHSPRGFRRLTVRVVLLDEVDGYPPMAGKEGDQIALAKRRNSDFWNRKTVIGSSPAMSETSKVLPAFRASRRGYYMVPCPDCGEHAVRKFSEKRTVVLGGVMLPVSHLTWPEGEPEAARWVCPHCATLIVYEHHREMLDRGYWLGDGWTWRRDEGFRFEPGFNGRIGFEIWAGYSVSPNATPAKLAEEFEQAKGSPETMQTFVNTIEGEGYEETEAVVDARSLEASADPARALGEVPSWAAVLTAGVDTQGDRLAVQVLGWGWRGGLAAAVVDWYELPGDPTKRETWAALREAIDRTYPHPCGAGLRPTLVAVDSGGHWTQEVYGFARDHGSRGVLAVKGMRGRGPLIKGKATKVDFTLREKPIKGGASVWIVYPDVGKSWLHKRLAMPPGERPIDFPTGLEPRYFDQLTAERFDKDLGRWTNPGKRRNEALDTAVYAIAAAHHPRLRLDVGRAQHWSGVLERLHASVGAAAPPRAAEPPKKQTPPAPAAPQPAAQQQQPAAAAPAPRAGRWRVLSKGVS